MIKLIINADDFGSSRIFNEEILKLLADDLIRSTTVLVNRINKEQKNQVEELKRLKNTKPISVGLHFEPKNIDMVEEELKKQYDEFISIFDFSPSHLDVHVPKRRVNDSVMEAAGKFAEKMNLPYRKVGTSEFNTKQTTDPAFVVTYLHFKDIKKFLDSMKDNRGYEIITHPGRYDLNSTSSLNKERENDVENIIMIAEYIRFYKNIVNSSYLDL